MFKYNSVFFLSLNAFINPASVFCRVLEQRQLRESLQWWHWKTLRLDNLACCNPKDLPEESLLASLDLEESSLSSGFHSNTPALPVSGGTFIKVSESCEQASFSVP